MRKASFILAAALVSFLGLSSANAMSVGQQAAPDSNVTLAWGGCGPAFHPNPWGRCVPNGGWGYRGYAPYGYRPYPPVVVVPPVLPLFHPWHRGYWHRR